MRRDDHVVHRKQRIVPGRRLDGEDVDSRTGDALFAQCVDQRVVLHDRSASGIDEVGRRLHLVEQLFADQPARILVQERIDGEEIALPEQCIDVDHLDAESSDLFLLHVRVGRQQTAEAQRPRQAKQLTRDVSAADRAQRVAGNVPPQPRQVAAPLAGARKASLLGQILQQREDQRQNRFGDRTPHGIRRNAEHDAGLGQRVGIDHVVAHTPAGHRRQPVDSHQALRLHLQRQPEYGVELVERIGRGDFARLRRHRRRLDAGPAQLLLEDGFELALGFGIEIGRDPNAEIWIHNAHQLQTGAAAGRGKAAQAVSTFESCGTTWFSRTIPNARAAAPCAPETRMRPPNRPIWPAHITIVPMPALSI